MVRIKEIYDFLDRIAPFNRVEEWDNSGILTGSPSGTVERAIVTLDITREVIDEAENLGCGLIISHHPVIFRPLAAVLDEGAGERTFQLARSGITAICMHTNLDGAEGGVNDVLAGLLELKNISDVPGNPYLRMGEADGLPFDKFLEFVKVRLSCNGIRYIGGGQVRRVMVGGGALGEMWRDAMAAGCDVFVTGEIKFRDFLEAEEAGMSIIEAGHYATEWPVMPVLAERLKEEFPRLDVLVSRGSRDIVGFFGG